MNSLIKFSLCFFSVTLLFNCNINNDINEKLKFDIKEKSIIPLSNLVSEVKYISLEKTENSIIGAISKIIFANDKIYILDGFQTKSLYVFDNIGKYLFKIDKQGKGPGEYGFPMDFNLDKNNNIYIGDVNLSKIIRYDENGNYIEDYKYSFKPDNIVIFESGFFGLGLSNIPKENTKEKGAYHNFILTNKGGEIIKRLFPIKDYLENHSISSFRYMSNYNNNLYFHPPLSTDLFVYNIDDDKLLKHYSIDYGIEMPDEKFYLDNFNSIGKAMREGGYPRYFGFSQTNKYFNFSFNISGIKYHFFLNKLTNEMIGTSQENFQDDILCGGLNINGKVNNDFFGWLERVNIDDLLNEENSQYNGSKLSEVINTNSENDNPIILIYRMK